MESRFNRRKPKFAFQMSSQSVYSEDYSRGDFQNNQKMESLKKQYTRPHDDILIELTSDSCSSSQSFSDSKIKSDFTTSSQSSSIKVSQKSNEKMAISNMSGFQATPYPILKKTATTLQAKVVNPEDYLKFTTDTQLKFEKKVTIGG